MEWQRRNSECDVLDRMLVEKNFRMRGTSGWNGGGERNSGYDMSGWNVVMSSMKVRYGLYGYGGLGEWF